MKVLAHRTWSWVLIPVLAITLCAGAAEAGQEQDGRVRLGAPAAEEELAAMYRRYYESYRLAPDDEIAIHVMDQPEYSIEKVKVSPLGRVYHPLLGDVQAAGLTVDELTGTLTAELREYIRDARVSVSLRESNGAKIGVLGEVVNPGVITMARPMRVLDAIAASGGFTSFSKSSSVVVLRQRDDGGFDTLEIDVKEILEGEAAPQENVALRPGDTVVVQPNRKKTLAFIASIAGLGNFFDFMRP